MNVDFKIGPLSVCYYERCGVLSIWFWKVLFTVDLSRTRKVVDSPLFSIDWNPM